jgi:zeaxanthin glucosyltransferase
MKPRVVFMPYHGFGHYNPCLKIAHAFRKDHEVYFAGHAFFKQHILDQGFKFYSLQTVPFGMGFEYWANTTAKKKNPYWASVKDRWSDTLYYLREAELKKMLEALNPEYLLIDPWQSTDFVALYPSLKGSEVKTAFFHATLPTSVEKNIPPMSILFSNDSETEIAKTHRAFSLNRLKKEIVEKIKFFGADQDFMIRRRIKKNHLPEELVSSKKTFLGQPVFNMPEFICAPAEFNFASEERNVFQHYIGFQPYLERRQTPDEKFLAVVDSIDAIKKEYQYFFFCSFGTVAHVNLLSIRKFLDKLIAISGRLKAICLIAINSKELVSTYKEQFENVFVCETVPQLQVLSYTDIFITHGGMNSVKEGIYAEVPMLVYPVITNTDLNGNASRISFYGLGLDGQLDKDTEADVERKITELLSDQQYRQNIIALKETDMKYTIDNAIEEIKKWTSAL